MRVLVPVAGFLLVFGGSGDAGRATYGAVGPAPPAATAAGHTLAPALAPVSYAPPVSPMRVIRAFDPPATQYGSGHRGVDLTAPQGDVVRSAGDGVVRFAGSVAGRGLVVVQHADGIRTEYEPLHPSVSKGAVVRRGQALGVVRGTHRGCESASCLHWGARNAQDYLDPLLLLRQLGPVRLLPWTG